MIQATKPTFSFGVILLIAIGLVGAVYYFNQQLDEKYQLQLPMETEGNQLAQQNTHTEQPATTDETAEPISTENWKEYNDPELFVSFKYPDNWQVRTYARENFDIIVLTPNKAKDKVRIYVSNKEYVGLAGVKTTPTVVGGLRGVSASDMVFGVRQGANYFTFDVGQDPQLMPEFNEIIKTVAFIK